MAADVPLAVAVLVMVIACDASALGGDRARDEAAIRQLQARQQDAWNRHDAKAYAALFSDDGDVVNVVGWWWKGPRGIERQLRAAYTVVFRDSRLTIVDLDVSVPRARHRRRACPLDDGRREDAAFDPRAPARHSDSGAAEA